MRNEIELLQIENRQLKCDVSEKKIIIEDQVLKIGRLNKEVKETRDRLFNGDSRSLERTYP